MNWFERFGDISGVSLLITVVDVLAVAFVIYKLIMVVKGTRAWQIAWGLVVFFLFVFISELLHLRALNWLLRVFLPLGPVALVILFYPELRHALEEIGRLKFLGRGLVALGREDITDMVNQLSKAAADMAQSRIGALVVIEREVGLDNIIEGGSRMDALVSAELLRTIFHPGSPLHDGAVIIRGNRIVAASCTLPLSDSPRVGTMIHTRHKAALGVSEESDAVVLVVSEETGMISLSVEGALLRGLEPEKVRTKLLHLLQVPKTREGVSQIRRTMSSAFSKMRPGTSSERRPKC
ncbi:MAG TPA: diadenylate cyclase CdaA [Armatimonadota bacterium]|nr:diadenylate cyclase CdaA [Armatimonadota bacterium]